MINNHINYDKFITFDKESHELYGTYIWVPNYKAIRSYTNNDNFKYHKLLLCVYTNIEYRSLNRH